MTDEELQRLVEHISLEYFHRPFRHQASFNSRLRTTGGRYLTDSHVIELNEKQLDYYGLADFIKIIKHELCHYHLHLTGKGFHHYDADFKRLLRRVGGSRFCGSIPGTTRRSQLRYHYRCAACGRTFIRKRKLNTSKYVCATCGGKIHLVVCRRLNLTGKIKKKG
ncbi:MAG: SprT family protein [Sporolactobacillus sp.]|jgi:SprT-like protein|nr:SprT family protein [Sporolactobacillus sp.]MCI1882526.1 SprT family protein [Sporolactobacillus sp.]